MSGINWIKNGAFEDAPIELMDRIKNSAGEYPLRTDISTIKYKVFACETEDDVARAVGTQVGAETTETVGSVLFDTLQTDDRWTADTTGYNLRIVLPPGSRPDGGWHRVEVVVTPNIGHAYPIVWGIKTLPMAGS